MADTPTTNVPAPTFSAAGFIAPLESAILAGVVEDLQAAFGGNLNTSTTAGAATNATPQMQLANSMAAIIGQAYDLFVYFTNQVDPASAVGRMQDAIARIYFLTRFPAQPTTVNALCTGLPGTTIPLGALAVATDGTLYTAMIPGVISQGGNVTLPFAAVPVGPIACPANTLTQIFRQVPGWSGITNPTDGVIGSDAEGRAAFEQRRANSVAGNSAGAVPSVVGAVLQLPGILSVKGVENTTAGTITTHGVVINPHTLYLSAAGGLPEQIATTIWTKKAPGCGTQGNTTLTVYDNNSGYTPPLPSYQISYTIPDSVPIYFDVLINNTPNVPSDAYSQVQAAIQAVFSGVDGGVRPGIADEVLASRFYGGVQALAASWGSNLVELTLSSPNDTSTTALFTGSVALGGVLTVTAVSAGSLQGGMFVSDGTLSVLPDGVLIVSQLSGTVGGTGTYLLSSTLVSAGSIPMLGIAPFNALTIMKLNQIPTYFAGNMNLELLPPPI